MKSQPIKFMTKSEAIGISHTLSRTSKMPSKSYSLPAVACKTGSKLREIEGSVCSGCYAYKNAYAWEVTQVALRKRLETIYRPEWPKAMATLIGNDEFFRWHDSGDIQSIEHLQNIIRVAELTPNTSHWLPTKELGMLRDFIKDGGVLPDNLLVRVSAPMIDSKKIAVPVDKQITTSRSVTAKPADSHLCPAPKQDNTCGSCRACWDKNVDDVSYMMH